MKKYGWLFIIVMLAAMILAAAPAAAEYGTPITLGETVTVSIAEDEVGQSNRLFSYTPAETGSYFLNILGDVVNAPANTDVEIGLFDSHFNRIGNEYYGGMSCMLEAGKLYYFSIALRRYGDEWIDRSYGDVTFKLMKQAGRYLEIWQASDGDGTATPTDLYAVTDYENGYSYQWYEVHPATLNANEGELTPIPGGTGLHVVIPYSNEYRVYALRASNDNFETWNESRIGFNPDYCELSAVPLTPQVVEIDPQSTEGVTMTVAAYASFGEITYSWSKWDNAQQEYIPISGANGPSYVSNETDGNGVRRTTGYRCVIENDMAWDNRTIDFTVMVPNLLVVTGDYYTTISRRVDEATTLSMDLLYNEGETITYQWYIDDWEDTGLTPIENATSATFEAPAYEGYIRYCCVAMDRYGNAVKQYFSLDHDEYQGGEEEDPYFDITQYVAPVPEAGEETAEPMEVEWAGRILWDYGKAAVLTIDATLVGETDQTDLTYQWYRNAGDVLEPISGATGTSYTVEHPVENETYHCYVTNGQIRGEFYCGFRMKDRFTLTAETNEHCQEEEDWEGTFYRVSASTGETVTLKAIVDGADPDDVEYMWLGKNGIYADWRQINCNSDRVTVTLDGNQLTGYQCIASANGMSSSIRFVLDEILTSQVQVNAVSSTSVTVEPGSTADVTLSVSVSGGNEAARTIYWYRESDTGMSWQRTRLNANQTTLTIPADEVGSATYVCFVTDGKTSDSVRFSIHMNSVLTIEGSSGSETVDSGANCTLWVTAHSDSGLPLNYQWYKLDRNYGGIVPIPGATGASYETGPLCNSDGYETICSFICVVSDGYNYTESWMDITVRSVLQAEAVGGGQIEAEYGQPVTLQVSASNGEANPTFYYYWYEHYYDEPDWIWHEDRLPNVTGNTYQFTPQNNHDYVCEVIDSHGRRTTVHFYINIDAPITVTDWYVNIPAEAGEDVELDVTDLASTVPGLALHYEWALWTRSSYGYSYYQPIEDSDTPVWTVPNVLEDTSLCCTVRNGFDSAEIEFYVDIDTSISLEAVGSQDRLVAFGGEAEETLAVCAETAEGLTLTYSWYRRTGDEFGDLSDWEQIEGSGDSITLTGIDCYQEVRCDASNGTDSAGITFFISVDSGMTAYCLNSEVSPIYGEDAEFAVEATAQKGELHYRWFREGYYDYVNDVEYDTALVGGDNSTLTVSNVTRFNHYYCVVSNGYQRMTCYFDFRHIWSNTISYTTEETTYEWVSNTEHRPVITRRSYRDCYDMDCSEQLVETEEILGETEAHTPDENGFCAVCGRNISGSWYWETGINNDLIIHGYGTVSTPIQDEWEGYMDSIQRIKIDGEISGIGADVFAGFDHTIHIDFLGRMLPEIDENAFGNTTAVCRYYNDDTSWANAGTFGGSVSWIRLPAFVENDMWNNYLEYGRNGIPGWEVRYEKDYRYVSVSATPEQAMETFFRHRYINLYRIPETAAARAPYEADWDLVYFLNFLEGCTAPAGEDSFVLNVPAGLEDLSMDIQASTMDLTVNTPGTLDYIIIRKHGRTTVNGNVRTLVTLEGPSSSGSITINGDVDTLEFHDSSDSDNAYMGTVTVTGTVANGVIYGTGTAYIPRIGEKTAGGEETDLAVSFGNILKGEFSDVEQEDPIAENGTIQVPGITPKPAYTKDNCYLHYDWDEMYNDWSLCFEPISEIYGAGVQANVYDLENKKEGFGLSDIQWGDHTGLIVERAGWNTPVQINGENGTGLDYLHCINSNVAVNCPVNQMQVYYRLDMDGQESTATINSTVTDLRIDSSYGRVEVSTGSNGSVQTGRWERAMYSDRYFRSVGSSQAFFSDGHLNNVMSWRQGEETRAILPGISEIATAAGLGEGHLPAMDVRDSDINLDDDERAALEALLADDERWGSEGIDNIVSVFSTVIFDYDDACCYLGEITEMQPGRTVDITVNNPMEEGSIRVARLHNENGTITADAVSGEESGDTVTVSSDRFSRFVILSNVTPPKTLDCGYPYFTWYTGLTETENTVQNGPYSGRESIGDYAIPYGDRDDDAEAPVWSLIHVDGPDCFQLVSNNDEEEYYCQIAPQEGGIGTDVTGVARYRVKAEYNGDIYYADVSITLNNTDVSGLNAAVYYTRYDPSTYTRGTEMWQDPQYPMQLLCGTDYIVTLEATSLEGMSDAGWSEATSWYGGVEERYYYDEEGNWLLSVAEAGLETVRVATSQINATLYQDSTNLFIRIPLTVSVIAPYGKLEDALTVSAPTFVTPGEAFTISLTDLGETEGPVPDNLEVVVGPRLNEVDGYYTKQATTKTITVPAVNQYGNDVLPETGRDYRIEVTARKAGWEPLSASRVLIAAEPSAACTMTINGSTNPQELFYGEDYTIQISGLPEDLTVVRILDLNGDSWSVDQADYTDPYTMIRSADVLTPGVPIIASFTTDPRSYSLDEMTWTYTNAVTVSVVEAPDPVGHPESITPGEDVVITVPEIEGADSYQVFVDGPTNSNEYVIESSQPGAFVIPAMVFADGGNYVINVYVCEAHPADQDWPREFLWKYYDYNVTPYEGPDKLTITTGTFTAGAPIPVNLSVTDADRVIVQERETNTWGLTAWITLCVEDNPGAAVNAILLTQENHLLRASVKQNGVWSAWSYAEEFTTTICGQCNDDISWALDSEGKLTITGTGEIPYEMTDSWSNYLDNIREVEIGDGITGIGNWAFSGCGNMTTVTIPASLTTIGEGAFAYSTSLTAILSAGEDRTEITRCYEGNLKTFNLPSTVTSLGYCAFIGSGYGLTTSLSPDFNIPAGTGRIEDEAFFGIGATHVRVQTWSLGQLVIGEKAFGNCTSMRYFQVDGDANTSYTIDGHAFDNCSTELVFIGIHNDTLRQFAEDHGFTYLENEGIYGNG